VHSNQAPLYDDADFGRAPRVSRNKTTRNSLTSGDAEAAVNSAKLFWLHISIGGLVGLTDDRERDSEIENISPV